MGDLRSSDLGGDLAAVREIGMIEGVRRAYHDDALPWAMKHPYVVFLGSWGLVIVAIALRTDGLWTLLVAAMMAAISGWYYRHRIGGITGDCLGATTQLTEIAVYLMGAVLP